VSALALIALLASANPAPSSGEWDLAFVPKITFNADDGFGLGLRGTAFWHRWGQRPYKTAITAQIFATTRLVQHHFLKVDAVDAFNLPLRLEAELGYFQSRSQNFCGYGGEVSCDPALATDPNFYKVRYLRPYARARARYRLDKRPHKPELFAGWRGHFYQPGDLVDEDRDGAFDFFPFPGSLYDQVFPGGERGLASVIELGGLIDDRDHEASPRRGYLVLASVRGAHPAIGSTWSFLGLTAEARVFAPLVKDHLTIASRLLVDQMFGDAPLQELARVGTLDDGFAYGGLDMGRGIRVQRYMGKLKAITQHELRFFLPTYELGGSTFEPGAALFVDGGVVALDAHGETLVPAVGYGVSLRVAYNQNFTMRLDIGFSPDEGFRPLFYSSPGYVF
jgi:hypothetical protein